MLSSGHKISKISFLTSGPVSRNLLYLIELNLNKNVKYFSFKRAFFWIVEFEFSHMTLGHSGFLIFWKSNTTPDESISDLQFRFGYRIKDAKNTNFSFPKSNSPLATSTDQYKIGSLQENTLYEVLIQQHFGSSELETE